MDASTNYYLLLGIYDPDDDLSGSSDADPEVMGPIREAIRRKQLECSRASRNPRASVQLEAKRNLELLLRAEDALDTQAKREEQFDEADAIIDQTTARHLGNFASKGFIAAPEINLIVDKIADETNYKPTPAAVRMSARRRHIEIRRASAPRHGLTPLEPPKPASFKDYEALRPHLDICGADDLYTFLGGSPRTSRNKPVAALRDDASRQLEAMPRKHDTLTKARTKLLRCCMDQAFASEQSKADYDAYLRYLEMTKVLAAAGESCAYTKTMESTNQAPHFIQQLREASGATGTPISTATAAGYLLWYCHVHDIACMPAQWHLDGSTPQTNTAQPAGRQPSPSRTAQPSYRPAPRTASQQPSSRPAPRHASRHAPQPNAAPPQSFIFVTRSGERITITNASQLAETIGKHTYETLALLSSPNQLDPALAAWLRTLPNGNRLVSALLSESMPIGRYLILQRMLAPSRPIHYRGIGLDRIQDMTMRCSEAGDGPAGRNKENDDWYRDNQWLEGLLVTDRVISTYDRLIKEHPAFSHSEFDRNPAIPRLAEFRRQYLEVESALRGTRWRYGWTFRNMIEIIYKIALGSRGYLFLLTSNRKDITDFLLMFEGISTEYGYRPDKDMSTLVQLARKAQSARMAQIGFVFSLADAIQSGTKELKANLDNARKQRAPRPQQTQPAYTQQRPQTQTRQTQTQPVYTRPRPQTQTQPVYTQQQRPNPMPAAQAFPSASAAQAFPPRQNGAPRPPAFYCPFCGTAVYAGMKFCSGCHRFLQPYDDGRSFPGTERNAPCPCGSGLKYKKCHGRNER